MTVKEKYERIKFTHEQREKKVKRDAARAKAEPICGYLKHRNDKALRHRTRTGWYEFPVSDSQAYKMLGNGWTCEVIAHILKYLKEA